MWTLETWSRWPYFRGRNGDPEVGRRADTEGKVWAGCSGDQHWHPRSARGRQQGANLAGRDRGYATQVQGGRCIQLADLGFPDGSAVENPPATEGDVEDAGLIPGSEKSPGAGNGNPLQHACLENPTDRGAWWATVHGSWRGGCDRAHIADAHCCTGETNIIL